MLIRRGTSPWTRTCFLDRSDEEWYETPALMLQASNIAYANSREMHQSVMKKKILNRY